MYGFLNEIYRRYGDARMDLSGMWGEFNIVFSYMPIAGLVGGELKSRSIFFNSLVFSGRILCMHGGLSPSLTSIDQIRKLPRGWYDPPNNQGLMMDLIW
jgi:diadenosine tetraphosphatase ApaH/serine/threonine PP2A family protein phosphatase